MEPCKTQDELIKRYQIKDTNEWYAEYQGKEYLADIDEKAGTARLLDDGGEEITAPIQEVSAICRYSIQFFYRGNWELGAYSRKKNLLERVEALMYEEERYPLTDADLAQITDVRIHRVDHPKRLGSMQAKAAVYTLARRLGLRDTQKRYAEYEGKEYAVLSERQGVVTLSRSPEPPLAVPAARLTSLYQYQQRLRCGDAWYQAAYCPGMLTLWDEDMRQTQLTAQDLAAVTDVEIVRNERGDDLEMMRKRGEAQQQALRRVESGVLRVEC